MRKVEVTATIQATPESIIAAFTEPDMLKGWWGVERTLIDKRPGGCYTIAWQITPKGFGYVTTGVIEKYDPSTELVVGNLVYLNQRDHFLGPCHLP